MPSASPSRSWLMPRLVRRARTRAPMARSSALVRLGSMRETVRAGFATSFHKPPRFATQASSEGRAFAGSAPRQTGCGSGRRAPLGRELLGAGPVLGRQVLEGIVEPRLRQALRGGHQVPGGGLGPVRRHAPPRNIQAGEAVLRDGVALERRAPER